MTAASFTDRRDADDATFAAELARLDRLEVADEGAVERVARAICESDGVSWHSGLAEGIGLMDDYRKNARAAIDALKPAPGTDSSSQAVQRVLDLADELDSESRTVLVGADLARQRGDSKTQAVNVRHARITRQVATQLRAAVAGPQRGHGEGS